MKRTLGFLIFVLAMISSGCSSDHDHFRGYEYDDYATHYYYYDGYYYMISLESAPHHRWLPYIVRTRDLRDFELGLTNPIMYPSNEDKNVLFPEKFTAEQLDFIENAIDCNNSDVDLCEYKGKTYINFVRDTQKPTLELYFYEELRAIGIKVKVESNQR